MATQLRDTHARLRFKVPFFGLECGVLPIVISASISAVLIAIASQSENSVAMGLLGAVPFVSVVLYILIFVNGRRPHFTRDLVCLFLNGKSLSPCPPKQQPVNPCKITKSSSDY